MSDKVINTGNVKRSAWIVTMVAVFAGITMAWAQNKLPPVIGSVMEAYSISMSAAGWLSSVFGVMGIVMAIPAASLIQKWGLKVCGAISLIMGILGGLLGVFAPNVTVMLLSRLLEGIGVGLIAVIAPSVIAMWFPPEKRGLPMGIWGSYQMVAQSLAFLLAGILSSSMGWKGMWWFGLVILVIALILYLWKIGNPPSEYNYTESEDETKFADVFKSKSVWCVFFVALFFCIGCFGWCTWAAFYLNEELGLDLEWANTIIGIIYMIEIGAVVIEGWILDRVKSRKLFGVITGILYCLLLLIAFRLPSAKWIIPFVLVYPFLEGAICTTFWTITPQTVKNPSLASGALALLVMGMNIGIVLGPPLIGYFIESFSWQAATIPMMISVLICSLLIAIIQLYNEKGEKIKG